MNPETEKKEVVIRFTREELKWIERTADIESARALHNFEEIVNHANYDKLGEKEKTMLQNHIEELIKLYTFLKELRMKLELWDCRFDINKSIKMKVEE